jgi:hypothetical protein
LPPTNDGEMKQAGIVKLGIKKHDGEVHKLDGGRRVPAPAPTQTPAETPATAAALEARV